MAWGGGYVGATLLLTFFVSGSFLSARNRRRPGAEPGPRTAAQVLANGGCAAVGALMAFFTDAGWLLLAGAIAAAQADTWATEIGVNARAQPRLITTLTQVPAGTSGGITLLGTVGGVAGAGVSAGIAGFMDLPWAATATLVAGVTAMALDSVLGATAQARFRCPTCGTVSERRRHGCGSTGQAVRGLSHLNNDGVNFLATAAGGLTAALWGPGL